MSGETSSSRADDNASGTKKTRCLAPFLSKTYDLLEGAAAPDVVSWNDKGSGFVVWLPQEFSQIMLPRYFKHCNFSSFIRQLNTYGFKKSSSDRWEFRHDKFQRGRKHLLFEITRRKCKPSAFPSFLKAREKSSVEEIDYTDHLVEENRALRKENEELQSQLARCKALESRLQEWLSQYV